MSNPAALVSKLWNYCSPAAAARDDGTWYGHYVEKLMALVNALETQLAAS